MDAALERLLAAIDAVNEALPYLEDQPEHEPPQWPRDPEDLLWAAQRTAFAAEELGHLVARLGDYAEEWATFIAGNAELATTSLSRHSASTYLARVKELPERLHAASRAMMLAARRGSLGEFRWFIERPRVSVQVGDLGSVEVDFFGEVPPRYGVRDARPGPTPLHERKRHDADSGGLVAAALDLDLADTQPRRLAREAAERARRELEAIVRYRDSRKPGDAAHAAQLAYHGDPADPQIAYAHRPDSTQDLVDVLLDVHREQWPLSNVLQDSLAAVGRVLSGELGGELAGVDELLSHPAEGPEIARHVRAIVAAWTDAAGKHERRRLTDPVALRAWLLVVINALGKPRRTDAIAARVGVDRDRIGPALIELEQHGLVARDDPLAAKPAWLLTDAGRAELSDREEEQ